MVDRARISFRPESPDDSDLLYRLYASTREREMQMVPWSAEQKEAFCRQQFQAQTAFYKTHFEDADYAIVLLDGHPVGRLYLHQDSRGFVIIDITLAPETRGRGIGTMLLKEILDRAAKEGKSVSIHVEQFNPALHLYQRLGFREVRTDGVYFLMEWRGGEPAAT